jgi:hypothetical protein
MSSLLAPIVLTIGLTNNFYGDDTKAEAVSHEDWVPEIAYMISVGHEDWPVYAVAHYETLTPSILGQSMAEVDALSLGLGARKKWDDFSFFAETGVALLDVSNYDVVVNEISYTQLVGNHYVGERRIPGLGDSYHDHSSSYELDDGLFFRVGVGYDLTDHLTVTAAYRALLVDQELQVWDEERRARGGGYWREDTTKDFNSVQVGVQWAF